MAPAVGLSGLCVSIGMRAGWTQGPGPCAEAVLPQRHNDAKFGMGFQNRRRIRFTAAADGLRAAA